MLFHCKGFGNKVVLVAGQAGRSPQKRQSNGTLTINDPRKKQKSFFISLMDKSSIAPAKSNDLALEMISYERFVFQPRDEKLIKKQTMRRSPHRLHSVQVRHGKRVLQRQTQLLSGEAFAFLAAGFVDILRFSCLINQKLIFYDFLTVMLF